MQLGRRNGAPWGRPGPVTAVILLVVLALAATPAAALPFNKTALLLAQRINEEGPFLGLVVAKAFEMAAVGQEKGLFTPHQYIPWLDLAGRRFHIGRMEGHKVILVQSAPAMLNAAITTQQLLDLFDVAGVLHYGIAGSTNNSLSIGDVTVPQYWAYIGLWTLQRFGTALSQSGNVGAYSQDIGRLHFADYNFPNRGDGNLLSNAWIQPEQLLTPNGTPERTRPVFWMQVDANFYQIAKQLEGMDFKSCFNATTCLNVKPEVVVGLRGASDDVFVDNAAYRTFCSKTFNVSSIDMESASVALTCLSNHVPFIAFRSISDSAGSAEGMNEASGFSSLASLNAVKVMRRFLQLLPYEPGSWSSSSSSS